MPKRETNPTPEGTPETPSGDTDVVSGESEELESTVIAASESEGALFEAMLLDAKVVNLEWSKIAPGTVLYLEFPRFTNMTDKGVPRWAATQCLPHTDENDPQFGEIERREVTFTGFQSLVTQFQKLSDCHQFKVKYSGMQKSNKDRNMNSAFVSGLRDGVWVTR